LTATTRIEPSGATPAVGDQARAVVQKPKAEGDPLRAVVLVLGGGPKPPGEPKDPNAVHGCGTITALPADPFLGAWTISVPNVADYNLTVTAYTKISPKDATPALNGMACFKAQPTDAGLVAKNIDLEPKHEPGEGKPEHKGIVVRGTVADPLPGDRSGDWTLTVAVEGAPNQTVLVTKDTEIHGDLAVGAVVVVHARQVTDAAGAQTLVADEIHVGPDMPPPAGQPGRPVRFEGEVKAASDTQWTITPRHGADIVVGISADTKIVGLASDADPVGKEVEGQAQRAADGSLVARMIRVK